MNMDRSMSFLIIIATLSVSQGNDTYIDEREPFIPDLQMSVSYKTTRHATFVAATASAFDQLCLQRSCNNIYRSDFDRF